MANTQGELNMEKTQKHQKKSRKKCKNVTCHLCLNETPASTAHLYNGIYWICDDCWDDRFKSSE